MREVQKKWSGNARTANGGGGKVLTAAVYVLEAIQRKLLNILTRIMYANGLMRERRRTLLREYEIESDGFVTKEEDLISKHTNFAEGFTKADKPYLKGYIRGLEVAQKFLEAEDSTPQEIADRINKMAITLQCEIEWLF